MSLLPLAVFFWRIDAEENALVATLGDRYRSYAAQHKRLIPFVAASSAADRRHSLILAR
jgi:protein-S-isoprenylcysteine O-methyltransferase Ste14